MLPFSRRHLIKSAVLATPLIITLAPQAARAVGSWSASDHFGGGVEEKDQGTFGQKFVVPGGYAWRRQEAQKQEAAQEQGKKYGGW